MIEVTIDLSNAKAGDEAAFYALPGVGRAVDALTHLQGQTPVALRFVNAYPAPAPDQIDYDDPQTS